MPDAFIREKPAVVLHDFEPVQEDLRAAMIAGLSSDPPTLPAKFFYDEAGSKLFEDICELPSYYLTRTELGILDEHLPDIADRVGRGVQLIELGSGAGIKTRKLLAQMHHPAGYTPIDISRDALHQSVRGLCRRFPDLPIQPVCADYSQPFELPARARRADRRVVYFPGSTIGNLHPPQARALFGRMRELAGEGGGLLLGVDMVKPASVLLPAYDDPQGVTAKFNLNLLRRLNREAGADFDLDQWGHWAVWNADDSRMESYLVSRADQYIHAGGRRFHFPEDRSIWTESSYKYTLDAIADLAEGFEVAQYWTDPQRWFSVIYLDAR